MIRCIFLWFLFDFCVFFSVCITGPVNLSIGLDYLEVEEEGESLSSIDKKNATKKLIKLKVRWEIDGI